MDCETVRDLAPLFVLDALEPDEAAAVRAHLAECDDVHAELSELAEAAGALQRAAEPVEPAAGLKSRLLAAAEADLREGRHPSTAAMGLSQGSTATGMGATQPAAVVPAPTVSAPASEPPVDLRIERERRRFRLATLGAAAAILLAVALGGYAVMLRGQLADQAAYQEVVDQALALAAQPGSATAVIAGADNPSSGLGVIGANGQVELAMHGLSATPGGEVYTAWAIGGDGTPRSLGDFDVGGSGTGVTSGTSPVTGAGTVLAITREPAPGATAPTGPIVASGSATVASAGSG